MKKMEIHKMIDKLKDGLSYFYRMTHRLNQTSFYNRIKKSMNHFDEHCQKEKRNFHSVIVV